MVESTIYSVVTGSPPLLIELREHAISKGKRKSFPGRYNMIANVSDNALGKLSDTIWNVGSEAKD